MLVTTNDLSKVTIQNFFLAPGSPLGSVIVIVKDRTVHVVISGLQWFSEFLPVAMPVEFIINTFERLFGKY